MKLTSALPAHMWHRYPRETVAVALLVAAVLTVGGAAWSTPSLPGSAAEADKAPPAPPPLLVRQLAPNDASKVNADIPLATGPNPAARPFVLGNADPSARARALECLTSAIYYEAANESADGQRAVAQVVLNRVRHPAFPATVCGVVYQGSTRVTGCQFTFTCDGSLGRTPLAHKWQRAREIAQDALGGYVHAPVGWATHYHADYVVPYWAPTLAKSAVIGAHIFYRWSGGWGRGSAFTQRYAQGEPNHLALRAAALEVEHSRGSADSDSAAQEVAAIPGAEALQLTPAMRRDKGVAVRFNLAARKASEEAVATKYLEKNDASDALRWSLTGGEQQAAGKPFGKSAAAEAPSPTSSSTAASQ